MLAHTWRHFRRLRSQKFIDFPPVGIGPPPCQFSIRTQCSRIGSILFVPITAGFDAGGACQSVTSQSPIQKSSWRASGSERQGKRAAVMRSVSAL